MNKILEWINKHKKLTVILLVIAIFLPIVTIHILFKIRSNCYWIEAEWGAGDVLGYFGDVLSFTGTVVLGYVAIRQTEKANLISEKLLETDLIKTKPCFDFINAQKYTMDFGGNELYTNELRAQDNNMILNILLTSNPRSGMETNIGIIKCTVTNSGHSDIRFIFIEKINFYLAVTDSRNTNEVISMFIGDTSIKTGESKTLQIKVNREFLNDNDLEDTWYKDNAQYIMPHLDMDLHIVTMDGVDYYEKISWGSNWDETMESTREYIERELSVTQLEVNIEK